MVYKALKKWQLEFKWNNIFDQFVIDNNWVDEELLKDRVERVKMNKLFYHLNQVDNWIFYATVEYFKNIWANIHYQ